MMRSRLLSPYTCPSTAPCCWVGVTPDRGTVILCWRALWKLDRASMLALKSTSMDASHGRSESLLWYYVMVNLDLTRGVNASALSVLWSAVTSGCLNWLAYVCVIPEHLYCLGLVGCKDTHAPPVPSVLPCPALPCPALPCPAPPHPAPPCPALPCPIVGMLHGISVVTVYINLKSVRSPVSITACYEDVFVVPSAISMKSVGSFIHCTCVFP